MPVNADIYDVDLQMTRGTQEADTVHFLVKISLSNSFSSAISIQVLFWPTRHPDNGLAWTGEQTWVTVYRDPTSGQFLADLSLSPYATSGDYELRQIQATNNSGFSVTIDTEQLKNANLQSSITFHNPFGDEFAPVLDSLTLQRPALQENGTYDLRVDFKVSDAGRSGLNSAGTQVEFKSPSGQSLFAFATVDASGIGVAVLHLPREAASGTYSVNSVRLSDYALNAAVAYSSASTTLENANADTTLPVLRSFNVSFELSDSGRPLLTYDIKSDDFGSGVKYNYLRVWLPNGTHQDTYLNTTQDGLSVGKIDLGLPIVTGAFRFELTSVDNAGNRSFFGSDMLPTSTLLGTSDPAGPVTLVATAGGQVLFGGDSDDVLTASDGGNRLFGGAGNDTLNGGSGDDTLAPGAGTNIVDGGAGTDTGVLLGNYADYTIAQTSSTTATLTRNAGVAEVDNFTNVERYRFADGVVLTLRANGGDYFDVTGKSAPVTLATGDGNDSILAGSVLTGADRIDGGAGRDEVGLLGNYTGANALVLQAGTLTKVESLALLTGGNYNITSADGTVAAGQVLTVTGNQLGANDSFTFNGSAETDGSFLTFGGLGTDKLTGGAGGDGFYFGPDKFGTDDVVLGGGGFDQIGLDGLSRNLTLTSGNADVESLALLRGPSGTPNSYGTITVDDSWVAAGQTKTITGNTAFQGQSGPVSTDLVIDGSRETNGNLRIISGSGNDTLFGGAGNDTIFGGLGRDRMSGGAGADTFVFNSAADSNVTVGMGGAAVLNYDTIFGFTREQDSIQVNGETFGTYTAGRNGRLDDATFNDDIATAVGNMSGSAAVMFTATSGSHAGETFLVLNTDGVSGYQAGNDLVLHLAPADQLTPPTSVIV